MGHGQRRRGVAELEPAGVPALVAALDDQYYSVRYGAARALAAVGESSVEPLDDVAERGTGPAQVLAIITLGEIGSKSALDVLRDLLDSDAWVVRAHAAEAIGSIGFRSICRD